MSAVGEKITKIRAKLNDKETKTIIRRTSETKCCFFKKITI